MIAVFVTLCLLVVVVAGFKMLYLAARLAWLLCELVVRLACLAFTPPPVRRLP